MTDQERLDHLSGQVAALRAFCLAVAESHPLPVHLTLMLHECSETLHALQSPAELGSRLKAIHAGFDDLMRPVGKALLGAAMRSRRFRLGSDREVYLASLHQTRANGNWLEGGPTKESNRLKLEHLRKRRHVLQYPALVIDPPEPPAPADARATVWLPRVMCEGTFESGPTKARPDANGSGLRVIWFQEHLAFPIDPEALRALVAIDWDVHAEDWSWDF